MPGESVYGEKRISVEEAEGVKTEYRVWNPFRSKLAASVLAGVDNLHIKPGCKVRRCRPALRRLVTGTNRANRSCDAAAQTYETLALSAAIADIRNGL